MKLKKSQVGKKECEDNILKKKKSKVMCHWKVLYGGEKKK